jgi:opacity protein-like surface antigen
MIGGNHRSTVFIGVVLVGTLLGPFASATADAGRETGWGERRGLTLGLAYQTSLIGAEDPRPGSDPRGLYFEEVGHGAALQLGYAFTPHFGLRFGLGTASHGTTQEAVEALFSRVLIEAHYRFLPRERARPYLVGGLGGASIRVDSEGYESEISGGVAVFGAGLLFNVTEHLVLDFSGRLDSVNWTETKVTVALPDGGTIELAQPVDESGSAGEFLFGVVWEF